MGGSGEGALLGVEGIDVSYGSLQVLFGVNLTVDEGSAVALLGTNGAGKSTLLRTVSGLLRPTAGSIRFDGRDITRSSTEDRVRMGLVQLAGGHACFPSLTVAENLRIGGYPFLRDRARVRRGLDRVLDLFPVLAERAHQPAGVLSGGEQQMMALGRCLIAGPRLLLIDELSLGLAPIALQVIAHAVEEVARDGVTVLLVEQSLNIAMALTAHAHFMEKGEVRFSGPTADLLERGDLVRSVFLGAAAAVPG